MKSTETRKDATTAGKPLDQSSPKAAKPADVERELSDEEIAAVAGGAGGGWNVQSNKTV
jgi:hypothetical protein